jgi:hypothetical protein
VIIDESHIWQSVNERALLNRRIPTDIGRHGLQFLVGGRRGEWFYGIWSRLEAFSGLNI